MEQVFKHDLGKVIQRKVSLFVAEESEFTVRDFRQSPANFSDFPVDLFHSAFRQLSFHSMIVVTLYFFHEEIIAAAYLPCGIIILDFSHVCRVTVTDQLHCLYFSAHQVNFIGGISTSVGGGDLQYALTSVVKGNIIGDVTKSVVQFFYTHHPLIRKRGLRHPEHCVVRLPVFGHCHITVYSFSSTFSSKTCCISDPLAYKRIQYLLLPLVKNTVLILIQEAFPEGALYCGHTAVPLKK